jgi:hypothetical protein
MDLTPLLGNNKMLKWSPPLLVGGWLLFVSATGCIDLLIILLLLLCRPIVMHVKEPGMGL